MSKILVIYHSQTGNTQKMAKSVAGGSNSIINADGVLKRASEATLKDLMECDGLAIGSPEYFEYMAGMIKDFLTELIMKHEEERRSSKNPTSSSSAQEMTGAAH